MSRNHTGTKSSIDFVIPELTDPRDIEAAFEGFADSIPPYPRNGYVVSHITAGQVGVAENAYMYTGATGVNAVITLPATPAEGDRVLAYQLSDGMVTFDPGTHPTNGGIPNTGTKYGVCSAVFVQGQWYFVPFGYSGTLPSESTGGDRIVDRAGFRYHVFTTAGSAQFVSALHRSSVDVFLVGGGANGQAGGATAGAGGNSGQIVGWRSHPIDYYDIFTLQVGGPGQDSFVNTHQGRDVATGGTESVGSVLFPDLQEVLAAVSVGGEGVDGAGPVDGDQYGEGGGGGFALLPSYTQTSSVHSWTTGGPYSYDCSYGARAENVPNGTHVHTGDPCVGGQCPSGWWCAPVGQSGLLTDMRCHTNVANPPITVWHCDSGGNQAGAWCYKECVGDNTQHHSETRVDPCRDGYTAQSGTCIDPRPTGGGAGHAGIVVIKYAIPAPTTVHSRAGSVVGLPSVPTIV